MFNKKDILYQIHESIHYDWHDYNRAISELAELQSEKERVQKAVDYMKRRDLSDNRYLFLFETAHKIADLIDVDQIDTLPIFKRRFFIKNVFQKAYDYFNLSDKTIKILYDFVPFGSIQGSYNADKNRIFINEPLFFTKYDMIFFAGTTLHEFWHYLQLNEPDKIEYYFSNEKIKFNKNKLSGKQKRILYRYCPFEQEAWFVGYTLMYFLHKRTKFMHASGFMKKLADKSDKDIIKLLANIDKTNH